MQISKKKLTLPNIDLYQKKTKKRVYKIEIETLNLFDINKETEKKLSSEEEIYS